MDRHKKTDTLSRQTNNCYKAQPVRNHNQTYPGTVVHEEALAEILYLSTKFIEAESISALVHFRIMVASSPSSTKTAGSSSSAVKHRIKHN